MVISRCTFGDIAPAFYKSESGISTLYYSKEVQLVRADIEIQWGSPSAIKGTFELFNKSDHEIETLVTFPIQDRSFSMHPDSFESACEFYDYRISLNESELKDAKTADIKYEGRPTWLENELVLSRGKNLIQITHQVEPRGVKPYSEGYKLIVYVMGTGRWWDKEIEEEVVTFIFPEGIKPENIHPDTKPTGYEVGKDYVKWTFKNLEPTPADDIYMITNIKPKSTTNRSETDSWFKR
jgi:hypothetical protein